MTEVGIAEGGCLFLFAFTGVGVVGFFLSKLDVASCPCQILGVSGAAA